MKIFAKRIKLNLIVTIYYISLPILLFILFYMSYENQECSISISASSEVKTSFYLLDFLYKERIKNSLVGQNYTITSDMDIKDSNLLILTKLYITNNNKASEFYRLTNTILEKTIFDQSEIFLHDNFLTKKNISVICKDSIPENYSFTLLLISFFHLIIYFLCIKNEK